MHNLPRLFLALALAGTASALYAQKPNADEAFAALGEKVTVGAGHVTGSVICADTGAPARFAKVFLKSATADSGLSASARANLAKAEKKKDLSPAEQKQQIEQTSKLLSTLSDMMISATVAVDGTYTFNNVQPGTYYVHASMPGYVDPYSQFSAADLQSKDPAVIAKIAAAVPVITVSGTDTARADLRLEHGASIQGRVVYDDGSPAVGWTVRTVYPDSAKGTGFGGFAAEDIDLSHISEASPTDDKGRFRISGLNPGVYTLRATMLARSLGSSGFSPIHGGSSMGSMFGLRLNVYSGNAYSRSEAKTITVTPGEERTDEEIVVPLRALHTVSGHVLAKADSHPVNTGVVTADAKGADGDPDPSLHFTATIQNDGSFRFDYLPGPATYVLKAEHAEDSVATGTRRILFSTVEQRKTLHKYGSGTATVTVGDTDPADVSILVPEAPAETK